MSRSTMQKMFCFSWWMDQVFGWLMRRCSFPNYGLLHQKRRMETWYDREISDATYSRKCVHPAGHTTKNAQSTELSMLIFSSRGGGRGDGPAVSQALACGTPGGRKQENGMFARVRASKTDFIEERCAHC